MLNKEAFRKEVKRIKAEKNLKEKEKSLLLALFNDNSMRAGTLEELGIKRGDNFKDKGKKMNYRWAVSKNGETAYFCRDCGWIIHSPQRKIERDFNIEWVENRCIICGNYIGGDLKARSKKDI